MNDDEELAIVKAFYRIIENLEVIQQITAITWVDVTLPEAKEQLKKFMGY